MKNRKTLVSSSILLLLVAAWVASARAPEAVVWFDRDTKNIEEPKERNVTLAETFVDAHMTERWKRAADVPRWVRMAVGAPKPAGNVNALDEVPDSSWFTNRHALRHMTPSQLVQGPNRGGRPDFSGATITKVKREGVTPGLHLKDKTGQEYIIKFDNKQYPELQSGAEVISTKILHAAGYNVPENYIAFINPANLEIESKLELDKKPFTREELQKILENAARRPDGSYRVLASKLLKGKPKGPFPYIGLRSDDANDLIPHEHRRELRGLRVISSWINNWDAKEQNTLDMYVEQNGRKFLRHYLIDFGSSLGAGKSPMEYFHGREYVLDTPNVIREIFTFGLYVTPDEKSAPLVMPEVGIFSANDFHPGDWKPSFRAMSFDNMTGEDARWATRIILSFSDNDILQLVRTAEYSNPRATEYIHKTLIARRQMVAQHWLKDGNTAANFALESGSDGVVLKFDDLLTAHDLGSKAEYRYEITNGGSRSERKSAAQPRIALGKALQGETRIRIWTIREKASSPVTLYVQSKPGGGYGIFRIDRT